MNWIGARLKRGSNESKYPGNEIKILAPYFLYFGAFCLK